MSIGSADFQIPWCSIVSDKHAKTERKVCGPMVVRRLGHSGWASGNVNVNVVAIGTERAMSSFVCRPRRRVRETSSLIGLAGRFLYASQGRQVPRTGLLLSPDYTSRRSGGDPGATDSVLHSDFPPTHSPSSTLSVDIRKYPAWLLGCALPYENIGMDTEAVLDWWRGLGATYILVLAGATRLSHRHGREEMPGA